MNGRRRDGVAIAAGVLLVAAVAGALYNLRQLQAGLIPDLPREAWWLLAGLAIGMRTKGRLGEYRQAARHTLLGVGRGHLDLIHGRRPR